MKFNAQIEINDETWNELSVTMKEIYMEKLVKHLNMAAHLVGHDLAMLIHEVKPFKVKFEREKENEYCE